MKNSTTGMLGMGADQRGAPLPSVDPKLWMLISPALPVGGYSYSQGLEQAVEAGWIRSREDAENWITGVASAMLPKVDLPFLARLCRALSCHDQEAFAHWNRQLLASRETSELRAEDVAMGEALIRLFRGLDLLQGMSAPSAPLAFAASFAVACRSFGIALEPACAAYAWVWIENQVAAAVKLVPLGQTQGQRILLELSGRLELLVRSGLDCEDGDLGMTLPGLAIASAAHETQYSRLFRS